MALAAMDSYDTHKLAMLATKARLFDGIMANIPAELFVPDTATTLSDNTFQRDGQLVSTDTARYITNVCVRVRQIWNGTDARDRFQDALADGHEALADALAEPA